MRAVRRTLPWLALTGRFLEPSLPLRSVRHHAPICGPPRFPMSGVQKLLIGGGSLLIMMIIPYWALFNIPRWSALHRGVPWYELEEKKKEEKQEQVEKAERVEKEEAKKESAEKKGSTEKKGTDEKKGTGEKK